ncbi:MAG: GNAT family N-acetyltransferase [Pseudomonadota bacterium]
MIRPAVAQDHAGILALYRAVAFVPNGIARTPDEVSEAYIDGFMHKAAANGLEFVGETDGRIVGEIHASGPGIASLDSLLCELTIAVAPDCQGQGVGRALFRALLDAVIHERPRITRVELFVRESNTRARALYASLGFVEEGRLRARVRNAEGVAEADIVMGWLRP